MAELDKVIKGLDHCGLMYSSSPFNPCYECPYKGKYNCAVILKREALELLKEQEKKQITLHKKHVVTWNRNDTFSMRNLYEAICEELLDEGELFIARTDDHEKVDFVFYVTEGR